MAISSIIIIVLSGKQYMVQKNLNFGIGQILVQIPPLLFISCVTMALQDSVALLRRRGSHLPPKDVLRIRRSHMKHRGLSKSCFYALIFIFYFKFHYINLQHYIMCLDLFNELYKSAKQLTSYNT